MSDYLQRSSRRGDALKCPTPLLAALVGRPQRIVGHLSAIYIQVLTQPDKHGYGSADGYHYICFQLSSRFDGLNLNMGVDFDDSGAIEGTERTDRDNSGTVDADEWRAFLNENQSTLRNFGGFFNYYFDHGTTFKPDNPLHDILFIESVIADETQIAGAYQIVEDVLEEFRPFSTEGGFALRNLHNIYFAMHRVGIEFENQEDALFTENILRKSLDCDTSSDVAMAVAHEMGWTVHLVEAPEHIFIRYDDGESRFNMDFGDTLEDDRYISRFNISSQSLSARAQGAFEDYNTALALDPNLTAAYSNRGALRVILDDYRGAAEDFNRTIETDPNDAQPYNNRGVLRRDIGDIAGAVRDLEIAVQLEPDNTKYSMTLLEVRMLYWNSQDMGGGPF